MLGLDEMLQDPEFLAEMRRELLQEAETATFEATAQVRDGTRVDFMNGLLGSRVYGGFYKLLGVARGMFRHEQTHRCFHNGCSRFQQNCWSCRARWRPHVPRAKLT